VNPPSAVMRDRTKGVPELAGSEPMPDNVMYSVVATAIEHEPIGDPDEVIIST